MTKQEHGAHLARAMGDKGLGRQAIADAVGVNPRTVTNWTTGQTMPSEQQRSALRKLLGNYDTAGDAVERAVRASTLHPWRQDAVLSAYKRNLHEQAAEEAV